MRPMVLACSALVLALLLACHDDGLPPLAPPGNAASTAPPIAPPAASTSATPAAGDESDDDDGGGADPSDQPCRTDSDCMSMSCCPAKSADDCTTKWRGPDCSVLEVKCAPPAQTFTCFCDTDGACKGRPRF